jgi:neurofibromin 1
MGTLRASASTLGTVDEVTQGPGKNHLLALEDLNMRGLASSFQFLPVNRGHATKMITWIPELVAKIISLEN